jgi:Fur family peroxide stress response transcriptional regulator
MNDQQFMARLRSKGYKVTPQRLAICKLILSSKGHPSADQIYREIRKAYPTISLATVYYTLDLMKDLGLVHELGFSDRSSRYDPNVSPHVNIICPRCGEIRDYETANVKRLWSQIIADVGLTPLQQRLDIYKFCDKCSRKMVKS